MHHFIVHLNSACISGRLIKLRTQDQELGMQVVYMSVYLLMRFGLWQ